MGEDESMSREYARDLSLIVGETDRLGQSVTQLLSFAAQQSACGMPQLASNWFRLLSGCFRLNADNRGVKLTTGAWKKLMVSPLSGEVVLVCGGAFEFCF